MTAGLAPANPFARSDAREVLTHLEAGRPPSLRVVRETPARLLAGERGRGESPGAFRRAPLFGLSARLAARRGFCFDALLGVSRDDDWTGWCLYLSRWVAGARVHLRRARIRRPSPRR